MIWNYENILKHKILNEDRRDWGQWATLDTYPEDVFAFKLSAMATDNLQYEH